MKEPQWAGGQHEAAWYVSNCNPEDRVAEQQRNIWRNKVLNFFFFWFCENNELTDPRNLSKPKHNKHKENTSRHSITAQNQW